MTLFHVHLVLHISLMFWMCASQLGSQAHGERPLVAAAGGIAWLRLLWTCRTLEVFRLGRRILPITQALNESLDFIFIVLFFGASCAHVAWSLSHPGTNYEDIVFSVYRLGALGDSQYPDDILYPPDGGEGPSSSQTFQYTAFVCYSFLLTIALTNIFIGVMSSAFDVHTDRVDESFLRSHAMRCLNLKMYTEGRAFLFGLLRRTVGLLCRRMSKAVAAKGKLDNGSVLFVCYPSVHKEGMVTEDSEFSLRRTLKLEQAQIADAVNQSNASLAKKLDDVVSMVGALAKRLDAITGDAGDLTAGQGCAAESPSAAPPADLASAAMLA